MAVLKYKDPTTGEYVSLGLGTIDVVDNLMSTSTTSALSANQGRVLNEKKLEASNIIAGDNITLDKNGNDVTINASQINVVDNLTSTSATSALSANQGNILDNTKVPMKNSTDNNVNCDNYYETGIYYLGTGLTNAPAGYIKLIVVGANKGRKGDVAQIAIAVSSGSVYIRTGNFSSSEQVIWWRNWITIYQNIVTGTSFATGRTIDGKIEYGKRINLGKVSITNNTRVVSTGLTNVSFTKPMEGMITNGTYWFPINGIRPTDGTDDTCIGAYMNGTNIVLVSKVARTDYTGYITVYYTEN